MWQCKVHAKEDFLTGQGILIEQKLVKQLTAQSLIGQINHDGLLGGNGGGKERRKTEKRI